MTKILEVLTKGPNLISNSIKTERYALSHSSLISVSSSIKRQ